MKRDLVTVSPETGTLEAIALMRRHRIGCLPVMRRGGGLRGRFEPRFRHATILAMVGAEPALREGNIRITGARVHPGNIVSPAFVVDDPYEELAGL